MQHYSVFLHSSQQGSSICEVQSKPKRQHPYFIKADFFYSLCDEDAALLCWAGYVNGSLMRPTTNVSPGLSKPQCFINSLPSSIWSVFVLPFCLDLTPPYFLLLLTISLKG